MFVEFSQLFWQLQHIMKTQETIFTERSSRVPQLRLKGVKLL